MPHPQELMKGGNEARVFVKIFTCSINMHRRVCRLTVWLPSCLILLLFHHSSIYWGTMETTNTAVNLSQQRKPCHVTRCIPREAARYTQKNKWCHIMELIFNCWKRHIISSVLIYGWCRSIRFTIVAITAEGLFKIRRGEITTGRAQTPEGPGWLGL